MNTLLFIKIVLFALVIFFNSDLKIHFNNFIDWGSKFFFGNQKNICRY